MAIKEEGKMWMRFGFVIVFATALAIGAGCGNDDDEGSAEGLTRATLMLPVPEGITTIGLVVAEDQGYFEEEGVDLETVVADEGSGQVNQLLIAGRQDYGYSTPGLTMIANAEGHDLRMIALFARDNFTIEVPEDSEVRSVEDLRGQALGVTDLAGGEISLVNQALETAGLEPEEDVELKVIGPGGPASFRALDSGEVAAYAGAPNDFAGMEASGFESRPIVPEELQGLPTNGFVASEETLEDPAREQIAIGMARAWIRGDLFTLDDPEAALDIVCERVPDECVDRENAEAFLDRKLGVIATPEGLRPGENTPLSGYETTQEALLGSGELSQEVDLRTVFPNSYIDEISKGLDG